MYRVKLMLSLLCLLALGLPAAAVLPAAGQAPPLPSPPSSLIDPQLWAEIMASVTHQATFVVSLLEQPGLGIDSTISAQFRLEDSLALLQQAGTVQAYQSIYGHNIIRITGNAAAVRFLAAWPETARISTYTPGQPWELAIIDSEALTASGHITGSVTNASGITPLSGVKATAYRLIPPLSWVVAGTSTTGALGTYDISALPTGIYRVKFEELAGAYVSEYYDDKIDFASATNFNVTDGQTTGGINARLDLAGRISGLVTEVGSSTTVGDIVASAWFSNTVNWVVISSAVTNNNGIFTIGSLKPGTYRVKFADVYFPSRYLDEWYSNKLDLNSADNVTVIATQTTPNINADMGWYGRIQGNVKADSSTTNLSGITVDAYQWSAALNDWEWVSYASTDASGNYEIYGLTTQSYRLAYVDPLNQFETEYYDNRTNLATADPVIVNLGFPTPNINAQLALKTDAVNAALVTGWNLISINTSISNPLPSAVFSTLSGNHDDIYGYNYCADPADPWKLYNPFIPSDLTTITQVHGYWVEMIAPDTLTTTGTHPLQTSLTLCPGWNLIGYPSISTKPIGTVLAGIAGKYNLVYMYKASDTADPWKVYNPSAPPYANDLKDMQPGYGYWIRMTQAATLTIAGR